MEEKTRIEVPTNLADGQGRDGYMSINESINKKIYGYDYARLAMDLEEARKEGKKIVMSSGTFDLFHIGHMRMLNAAKSFGDILIVAVKSDRAAALKKEDPPVIDEKNRMETVANCISSDYVIMVDYDINHWAKGYSIDNTSSFEWLTMFDPAVEMIKPDIFVHEDNPVIVKARQQLFNRHGVEGIIQPRTPGISTTQLIDTIKTRLLISMQRNSMK